MEASLVSIRALLIQGKDDLAIKLGRQVTCSSATPDLLHACKACMP